MHLLSFAFLSDPLVKYVTISWIFESIGVQSKTEVKVLNYRPKGQINLELMPLAPMAMHPMAPVIHPIANDTNMISDRHWYH